MVRESAAYWVHTTADQDAVPRELKGRNRGTCKHGDEKNLQR
ncbi:hypothetical protein [Rhodococcus jostii]|nr:hypothetical protein [Rhodococcus jostii]